MKWQVDVTIYGAAEVGLLRVANDSWRRFYVYGGTAREARARVSALVPHALHIAVRPFSAADNPLVYVDGRAAPGA